MQIQPYWTHQDPESKLGAKTLSADKVCKILSGDSAYKAGDVTRTNTVIQTPRGFHQYHIGKKSFLSKGGGEGQLQKTITYTHSGDVLTISLIYNAEGLGSFSPVHQRQTSAIQRHATLRARKQHIPLPARRCVTLIGRAPAST
ncbi:hypothetical protein AGR8A_pAt20172 [Agrobacterium fabrum str. J-07]|nr:hypothetical protein AGR8A_pAt20172 [Agrobacterium fabrum str. J-07]